MIHVYISGMDKKMKGCIILRYVILAISIWMMVGFLSTMKMILIDKTYQKYCKIVKEPEKPDSIIKYIMVGTLAGFISLIYEIFRNVYFNKNQKGE